MKQSHFLAQDGFLQATLLRLFFLSRTLIPPPLEKHFPLLGLSLESHSLGPS